MNRQFPYITEDDIIGEEINQKEGRKMKIEVNLENLTQEEQEQFKALVEKANKPRNADIPTSGESKEKTWYDESDDAVSKTNSSDNEFNGGKTDNSRKSSPLTRVNKKKVVIASIAVLLAILSLFAIFIPKTKTITVTEKHWQYDIEIEENKLVEESDWSVPTDAVEVLRQQREIHHYDHVLDHPVYQTKYYYTIWRWVYNRTETASGINNDPYWPEYTLAEKERVGKQTKDYSVKGMVKNKEKTYSCSEEIWNALPLNQSASVKVSAGNITEIKQ